jgi:hypothetical protein
VGFGPEGMRIPSGPKPTPFKTIEWMRYSGRWRARRG